MYVPREQWPDVNFYAGIPKYLKPKCIGDNPRGVRFGFFPFYIEAYVSDKEPDLILSKNIKPAPLRLVQFTRVTKEDVCPKGWHRSEKKGKKYQFGYIDLRREGDLFSWYASGMRRERSIWQRRHLNQTHEIRELSLTEFKRAYRGSVVYKKTGQIILEYFSRIYTHHHGESISIFGVLEKETGNIVAGIGCINSDAVGASYYYIGFFDEEASKTHAMCGLLDHWMTLCKEKGYKYADLGQFWVSGQPNSWKGFSEFKKRFNPIFVSQYAPVWRWILPSW